MAMGLGQGPAAEKLIRSSLAQPIWVVLENAHLAGDWLQALSSLVQVLPGMGPHVDFRLWLTTSPTNDFPASILQVGASSKSHRLIHICLITPCI